MSGSRTKQEVVRLDALLGVSGDAKTAISGLSADSRTVAPGYLFAALPGTRADGSRYIPEALARGAVAILAPRGAAFEAPTTVIEDMVPRRRFAEMAARFYGRQPALMAAVTGTNGKTSVASFARQLWTLSGVAAASLGTLGIESPVLQRQGGLTSPDPVTLHAALATLAARGVGHAICEASSHGLAQYRLDGVRFRAAAFTNLTRDHLDYHRSFEAYFHAKARLFAELLEADAAAVINIEGDHGRRMAALAAGYRRKLISVGTSADAGLRLESAEARGDGQRLGIRFGDRTHRVDFPLFGAFQALNALLAAGLVIACGGDPEATIRHLARLESVPGRLERVGEGPRGGAIFIDYAHTPDGLRTILEALRPHTAGRLLVVFGCGGDRDRGKRPEMGSIAAAHADRVIVCDDNPRSEDPAAIRRDILAAAPDASEIGDRRAAILEAVADLGPGDTLVIAGKGHEEGQIVGDTVIPFSDLAVVREAIAGGGP
ncbi:MAG: UDP-N-acetylmuramoyl-L-alanyl-D-glutamate--2,6-diaminopimelate ligase [Rhodothalassiaceae bacterium]